MSESKIIKAKADVEKFLEQFKIKMDIWGVFFAERNKNIDALAELGITEYKRKKVLEDIVPDDYIETIVDELRDFDMWVFGSDINGKSLYIKITMGKPNKRTICISFHVAEYALKYAFK